MQGLAPTPWQSGAVDRMSKACPKPATRGYGPTLIQLAWLWLRHQPQSALARWFQERVRRNGGRLRKKMTIVALARKLLVALWKYVSDRRRHRGTPLMKSRLAIGTRPKTLEVIFQNLISLWGIQVDEPTGKLGLKCRVRRMVSSS